MKPCSKCGKWQCECETVGSPAQVPTLSVEGTNTPPASAVERENSSYREMNEYHRGEMVRLIEEMTIRSKAVREEVEKWGAEHCYEDSVDTMVADLYILIARVEEIVAREAIDTTLRIFTGELHELGNEIFPLPRPEAVKRIAAYLSTHSGETQGKEKI